MHMIWFYFGLLWLSQLLVGLCDLCTHIIQGCLTANGAVGYIKSFLYYWSFVRVNSGDQWTSNVELWYLFCLLAWTAVEQTVDPPMILYVVMIPIMIMIMMIIIIIIINIVLIIIITIITIYTVRNNQTLTDLRALPDCYAPEKKTVGN